MATPLIQMRLLGGDAVSAAFLRMAQALPGATTQAAMAGAKLVEGFAKREGFRTRGASLGTDDSGKKKFAALGLAIAKKLTSRTGNLRVSIRHEEAGAGRAVVGPTAKYGAIHEFGGGRAQATTVRAHTRQTRWGVVQVKAHARAEYDMNMPARPYLRPALADHLMEVRAVMMKSIEKSLVAAKGISTLGEAAK